LGPSGLNNRIGDDGRFGVCFAKERDPLGMGGLSVKALWVIRVIYDPFESDA
jgi:hypothetical protein